MATVRRVICPARRIAFFCSLACDDPRNDFLFPLPSRMAIAYDAAGIARNRSTRESCHAAVSNDRHFDPRDRLRAASQEDRAAARGTEAALVRRRLAGPRRREAS